MPRNVINVPITAEGRDKGKVFTLTEASAVQTEKWAYRAGLLALNSGADVQGNLMAGFAGFVTTSIQALLLGVRWPDLEPLLDEMFECVAYAPDPQFPDRTRRLIDDDIEEVTTRIELRKEIMSLHLGFSFAGALSNLAAAAKAKKDQTSQGAPTSPAQ